jgi:hypothetical protein
MATAEARIIQPAMATISNKRTFIKLLRAVSRFVDEDLEINITNTPAEALLQDLMLCVPQLHEDQNRWLPGEAKAWIVIKGIADYLDVHTSDAPPPNTKLEQWSEEIHAALA